MMEIMADTTAPILQAQVLIPDKTRSQKASGSEASLSDSEGEKSEPEDIASLKKRLMRGQERRNSRDETKSGPSKSKGEVMLAPTRSNLVVETSDFEVRPRATTPGGIVKVGSDAPREQLPRQGEVLRGITPAKSEPAQILTLSQVGKIPDGYLQSSMPLKLPNPQTKTQSNSGVEPRAVAPRALSSSSSSSGAPPREKLTKGQSGKDAASLASQTPMKVPSTSIALQSRSVDHAKRDKMSGGQHSPMKVPCASSQLQTLAKDLVEYLSVGPEDVKIRKSCVYQIDQAAQQLGRSWRVSAVGSAANGFGTRFSDLDVTLYAGEADLQAQSVAHLKLKLLPLLRQHPDFEVVEEAWAVERPFVRFKFQDALDVLISCQTFESLMSSQLLQSYARMVDIVVRQFIMLVKLWAKSEEVLGERYGHLSSYAFTLMTIYFLQVDDVTQMPCLPVGYSLDTSESEAPGKWICSLPMSMLLVRFFAFFAAVFQWGTEVVSIRTGRRLSIDAGTYCQLHASRELSSLLIEDPLALGRNLGLMLGQVQAKTLYRKFSEATEALNYGRIPAGLAAAHHAQTRSKSSPFA